MVGEEYCVTDWLQRMIFRAAIDAQDRRDAAWTDNNAALYFFMQRLELRLRELRKARGFSQSQLAHKVGVTQATVAHWENGTSRSLRLETLDQLCRALACSPGELIRRRQAGPSKYEKHIRSELKALEDVVAAQADSDKRAQIDFRYDDVGRSDSDVRRGKATNLVLNQKNSGDGREAARFWLARAMDAAERGAIWRAVSLAYEAGFHHGLVWGKVWLRVTQFFRQSEFGSRPSEGARRGRPAKVVSTG